MDEDLGSYDVVVIGGGIAGISLAGELAAGARVLVLEREEHTAYHASGRSAAVSIEPGSTDTVFALTRATTPFLERPPPDFAAQPLVTPRGFLVLARAGEDAQIERFLAQWAPRCARLEEIGEAQARALVPVLRPGVARRFVLDAGALSLDTHAMMQGWQRRLRAGGGRVVTRAEVVAIRREAAGFVVRTPAGTARAPLLVNAAGAWASEVAARAGATPVALVPYRRSAAIVAPPAGQDVSAWPLVESISHDFYFKPEGRRLMLSPADETPVPAMDAWPEDADLAAAVERAEAFARLDVRRLEASWAGLRTFAADREPVFGWDPALAGFYWCAGQGGAGFHTAVGAARWCAAQIGVGEVPPALTEYGFDPRRVSPARFA